MEMLKGWMGAEDEGGKEGRNEGQVGGAGFVGGPARRGSPDWRPCLLRIVVTGGLSKPYIPQASTTRLSSR